MTTEALSVGMRCRLGLADDAANRGGSHEPPVSEPMAISHIPSAAETTAPDDEPPGTRLRSAGLPGVPKCGLAPMPV
jgi:hypothetical protein